MRDRNNVFILNLKVYNKLRLSLNFRLAVGHGTIGEAILKQMLRLPRPAGSAEWCFCSLGWMNHWPFRPQEAAHAFMRTRPMGSNSNASRLVALFRAGGVCRHTVGQWRGCRAVTVSVWYELQPVIASCQYSQLVWASSILRTTSRHTPGQVSGHVTQAPKARNAIESFRGPSGPARNMWVWAVRPDLARHDPEISLVERVEKPRNPPWIAQ